MRLYLLLLYFLVGFRAVGQTDTIRHHSSLTTAVTRIGHFNKVELLPINTVIQDTTLIKPAVPIFWYRADVNHDNVADFVVRAHVNRSKKSSGSEKLLVLVGGPHPTVVELDDARYNHINEMERVAAPLLIGGRAYIVYRTLTTFHTIQSIHPTYRLTADTLYLIQNRPMLYTAHPGPSVQLTNLNYSTTECFGTCPVFRIQIFPDRRVRYQGIRYSKWPGYHWQRLSPADYRYLLLLLQQLRQQSTQSEYAVNWTDDQTCYLHATFANDKPLSVADYGMQGTYGLTLLYQFLWTRCQPTKGSEMSR